MQARVDRRQVRGDVQDGDPLGGQHLTELRGDVVAKLDLEVADRQHRIGAGVFPEEPGNVGDARGVGPERAHPDLPELLVGHHHRRRGSPLEIDELAGRDVEDVVDVRRREPVLPSREVGQDRDVAGREGVGAGQVDTGGLTLRQEQGVLILPDDQFRPGLDPPVGIRVAPQHELRVRVETLNNFDPGQCHDQTPCDQADRQG